MYRMWKKTNYCFVFNVWIRLFNAFIKFIIMQKRHQTYFYTDSPASRNPTRTLYKMHKKSAGGKTLLWIYGRLSRASYKEKRNTKNVNEIESNKNTSEYWRQPLLLDGTASLCNVTGTSFLQIQVIFMLI